MMKSLVLRYPEQLKEAIEIGEKIEIKKPNNAYQYIYVAGLGGSGIGGNFVAELVRDELSIPYIIGKGYHIPEYINKHCLAICSSYSGNTEETLMAYEQLKTKKADIFIISSGGKLIDIAKKAGHDYVKVPDNWPSPRACLGYSLVQQIFVLQKLGLISDQKITDLHKSITLLEQEQEDIFAQAKSIAETIHGKLPIIYTTDRMEAVAMRWRQQFNENSKILAWHHVIPEMNHNELVGWTQENQNLAVLFLKNKDDYSRNLLRAEINQKIISQYTHTILDIYSKGESLIERAMYLVHLGDFVSTELAELRGVDAIEVNVIDYLKGELKKVAL